MTRNKPLESETTRVRAALQAARAFLTTLTTDTPAGHIWGRQHVDAITDSVALRLESTAGNKTQRPLCEAIW